MKKKARKYSVDFKQEAVRRKTGDIKQVTDWTAPLS
jgi:hypothetical protein